MKKSLRKPLHFIITLTLWAFAIFFLLGAAVYVTESILGSLAMLLLGLFLLPPVWKAISRKGFDKKTLRLVRGAGIVGLFFIAVAATPVSEPEIAQTAMVASTAKVATAEKPEPTTKAEAEPEKKANNNDQKLVSITGENGKYIVKGTGLANTEYLLKVSDSPNFTVKTDDNGAFSNELPGSTQMFGRVELTRDVNGFWMGGKETYDAKYFALNAAKPVLSDTLPAPVILGVGGGSKYEMSGYYTPKTTLILKTGNNVLASAKVDKSGRYHFVNIAPGKNYAEIALYEKVSTGWFSSKEEVRTSKQYLDTKKKRVLAELPVIEKELVTTEAIAFGSREVQSRSVEKGKSSVTQEGVNGEKKLVYKVTYRGNDETSRELLRTDISKQPVEKITTVGTYVAPAAPAPVSSGSSRSAAPAPASGSSGAYYKNCSAARAAGVTPIYRGEPGYRAALDRDNDGVACE